jgi:hypothetical protein
MGWQITFVEAQRELIREELLAYLRENKNQLTLSSPPEIMANCYRYLWESCSCCGI